MDADVESTRATQEQLFASARVPMLRLAYLLTGAPAIAEELVQDAFEQVVRRWDAIDQPSAYLRIAVVNGARSWGRRRGRGAPVGRDEPWLDLTADVLAVRTALARLRRPQREAIVLRYYAGLTDTQIADATGRPVGSVKALIHRGLRKLEEELG